VVPAVYSFLSSKKKGLPEALMSEEELILHRQEQLAHAEPA
jgi:hypothetical protein